MNLSKSSQLKCVIRALCVASSLTAAPVCAQPESDLTSIGHIGVEAGLLLQYAELEAGDNVALFPFADHELTELMCKAVGESGRVYVVGLQAAEEPKSDLAMCANVTWVRLQSKKRPAPELWSSSDDPGAVYEYWSFTPAAETFAVPQLLDLVVIPSGYDALHTAAFDSPDIQRVNRALWSAIKPNGTLLVRNVLSANNARSRDAKVDTIQVKREFVNAGFEFVDERRVEASDDAERSSLLLRFRKPPQE